MASETGQKGGTDCNIMYAVNDMVGRVVLINTTDNKRWSGVLSAISPEFEFGVELVVEVTKENENHLLRQEKDVTEKMIFKFDDIVDFAYITEEDKKNQFVSKFATDRQYHGDVVNENEELQAWNGGDDEEGIGESIEDDIDSGPQSSRRNNHNNGASGWSVNEMFAVNEKLKVVSTFKEDMTQYTTVDAVGTEEDRARAERIAREIESNTSSKFMANLENDDDERDLDKSTRQDEFENGNQRGNKRNIYNQAPQQRRNPNITPNGQPVNRRAEALRGDRRNSGGSSANNSRYGAQASTQNYQPPQQQGQKSGSHNNRRQNDDYRENDWQMAKGKGQNQGQDHSFRQQQKQMLDPRPTVKQPEGEKGQGSGSRVTELKNWGNEFSIATSPKEQSPAPGSTPPVSQGNSGSAWNRGPPSSLVTKGASTATPPSAEKETVEKTVPQTKEELPSTSAEGQTETDGRPDETDNVSVTGRSETSSVSKSQFFKFNINAPEFKPRAAPSTPTPSTPTGPGPQAVAPVQQQQFITQEYQQHPGLIPQGPPPGQQMNMQGGMMPHVPPGGVPHNQGQAIMMWPQGQQRYQQNQQFVQVPGVPGPIYGSVSTAPMQVNQQGAQNQQMPPNAGAGAQNDGRQGNQQGRRGDGEFREPQPLFYPQYSQAGQMMPVPQQFYQYQGGAPQQQYQMKVVPQMQQAPQGQYQQGYQRNPAYMGGQQRYQGPPPQQAHQFAGEHGGPQSHPNSQPNTPGPRGEMNGQKMQPQPAQPQNNNNGVQRETEAGSSASISGSASSQSGQRSGSPQTNNTSGPPQQQQQHSQQQMQQQPPPQHQQGPHGGHGVQQHAVLPPHMQQPQMVGVANPMYIHQMHAAPMQYYQQQPMYYGMMQVPQMQQMPNQHVQPSLMGERADTGYPQNNFFDYRTMPNYQQQQQQHQMHGGHMPPRQNSIPQQFGGNQGVNPSTQQAPPPAPQLQQQGGPPPPREQQPPPQQQPQSPQ
ncbi:hypothetical protein B9Z55_009592 [Caenorhabditis nigoni]|uniref:LsmAD domain-containing protein n=1 Tax=Caenorhabditis nigoni TaxID=1611254 RepID=A0A2G5UT45_9PELO|nr:hypothetical protein B9Z55_009592 [Caenorhabditis nigoni]